MSRLTSLGVIGALVKTDEKDVRIFSSFKRTRIILDLGQNPMNEWNVTEKRSCGG